MSGTSSPTFSPSLPPRRNRPRESRRSVYEGSASGGGQSLLRVPDRDREHSLRDVQPPPRNLHQGLRREDPPLPRHRDGALCGQECPVGLEVDRRRGIVCLEVDCVCLLAVWIDEGEAQQGASEGDR
ncbi:unnamed protein product [Linum tenue]|uniref:Uncharacterized protein n=1 Tax=Linum tenue TaxID=586396 RepID=A0AAV0KVK9_9ROSI|nr:unnamed protein product [Linum tenue]